MTEIVVKEKNRVPIVRKNELQLFKDYDKIKKSIENAFADSLILLTSDLQLGIDFNNNFNRKNLSKAYDEISWTEYEKNLATNIKSYTKIVSDKVLDYEETYGYEDHVKSQMNNWLDTNARTETIDISEKSKKAFRWNYNNYFEKEEEEVPQPLIIKNSLGLPLKYTKAVNNYLVNLRDQTTFSKARVKAKDYIRELRRKRAELIAGQELWETIVKTRIRLHDHLFMIGKLNKNKIGKQWVTRKNACDQCQKLDGEIKQWDENFEGKIKFPPAHVGCSCLYRLVKL